MDSINQVNGRFEGHPEIDNVPENLFIEITGSAGTDSDSELKRRVLCRTDPELRTD